jgi:hypothetical protein
MKLLNWHVMRVIERTGTLRTYQNRPTSTYKPVLIAVIVKPRKQ